MNRPSLDSLVPLVMIDDNSSMETDENLAPESVKNVLRSFESGDLVLTRLDTLCLPAIVFNACGLVMKFDIDRQLYHVCVLDQNFTEKWIDAADMISFSMPMIADCDDEQTAAMWSMANELLNVTNKNGKKNRLEEFQKRYNDLKRTSSPSPPSPPPPSSSLSPPPPPPSSANNQSQKTKRRQSSTKRTVTSPEISCVLTICEEHLIIEAVHRSSFCSFTEAKRIAEETYQKVIFMNNRENVQAGVKGLFPDSWFITFAIRQIEHFKQYATVWLTDLEALLNSSEDNSDVSTLISLFKGSD